MSASRQLTLQKAVQNVTKSIYFTNRWCSSTSMLSAVTSCYKLNFLSVTKASLNCQMNKLDPDIDNLSFRHHSGIYRGERSKEKYYFFQDPKLDPLRFPDPNSVDCWKDISSRDLKQLQLFLDSLFCVSSLHPVSYTHLTLPTSDLV